MSGSLLLLPEIGQDVDWGGKYDLRKGGARRTEIERTQDFLHGIMACIVAFGKGDD